MSQQYHEFPQSARLEFLMRLNEISREELAKISGVSVDDISQYLSGKAVIDDADGQRLSKALHIKVNDLMDPESTMNFAVVADDDLRKTLEAEIEVAKRGLERIIDKKIDRYFSAERLINAMTALQCQFCKRQQKMIDIYYDIVNSDEENPAIGDPRIGICLPDAPLAEEAYKLSSKLLRAYTKD